MAAAAKAESRGKGSPAGTRAASAVGPRTHTIAKLAALVLMVLVAATSWGLSYHRPDEPNLHTCGFSNQVHDSDASLMRHRAPTRLRLMTSRYVALLQAARGYNCTGTTTVAFNGYKYVQAGMTDDPGLAQLIPTIALFTGMSLADAFDLTAFLVIFLGILTGYAGFWRLFPDKKVRWVGALVFLCLALAEGEVADVYIFQISPLLAGIPWVLHFALTRKTMALTVSAALLAFSCSWCSLVRTGTTLICMVFLITLFIGRDGVRKACLPLLLIFLACVPSILIERHLIARRDSVLASDGEAASAVSSHPLWHSIYIGLAFIPNSQVPEYNDAVAMDKVRSIDPSAAYTSDKYELILRHEVLNLARHRPMLLIENVAAKAGLMVLLALIVLLPSRRLLFAESEVLWMDAAFVVAMGLSAMNVILVIPRPPYLLTFLCLTFLYSSLKVCRALSLNVEQNTIGSAIRCLVGWEFYKENRVRR
jgi:hypothetical protein